MTNADKKTLRARLVKLAQYAAQLSGNRSRWWVSLRMANGSSAPLPVTGKPSAKGFEKTKELLRDQGVLDQVIMMVVVDLRPSGSKAGPVVHISGDAPALVMFEYVTPKWAELTSVPGIKEAWQAQAQAFKAMVLPWSA